ncbi:MAG: TonB-dependent receptor [Pseudohongiellaceae bacterium]
MQVKHKKQALRIACTTAIATTSLGLLGAENVSSERLESILVIGDGSATYNRTLAGSLDVIGRDELEYEHVRDTLELFSKVPGVYLSRFNQGIINTDISIRGFAGDGSSPHAKLIIDGIPSNLHNGYNELDQLFPMGIESIEVFKGTSDPRYGLQNVAGNYNVASRSDVGTTTLNATVDTFGARELQAYTGLETGKLTQNYFIGFREGEGYRDRTDLAKLSASGRWFYQLTNSSTLAFIARHASYEGDAPGYLSADVVRQTPQSSASFANQDGGNKTTDHYSLHYDNAFSEAVQFSLKAYWQNFERERWVRFSEAGALTNRFDDQDMSGAIANLNWQISDTWALNVGADVENQDILEQRFGTIGQSRERDVNNVGRNRQYSFDTQGAFVQIENTFSDFLTWNVGVRADRLDGDFVQFNAAGVANPRNMFDFGTIVQPSLNIFLSPVDGVTVFGNYGRSFQHPFGADAYTSGNVNARDVSINDGWELGVRWDLTDDLQARISYWQQDASDEFISIDDTASNIGATNRDGIDGGLSLNLSDKASLWANFTTVNSEIVRPSDSLQNAIGNEIRSIPDFTASVGAQYQFTPAISGRIHIDSQGDYYVNENNLGGKFGDYTILNAVLEYSTNWGRVNFQLNNATDEFFEYVFDFGETGIDTIHSPTDGVNASVSFTLDFS